MILFSPKEYITGKYGFGLVEEVVCGEERVFALILKRNDEDIWRRKIVRDVREIPKLLEIAQNTLDVLLEELRGGPINT